MSIGRELCFWCIEAPFQCDEHPEGFRDDRPYFDKDVFRVMDVKELINVQTDIRYSETTSTSSKSLIEVPFRFQMSEMQVVEEEEEEAEIEIPKKKPKKEQTTILKNQPKKPSKAVKMSLMIENENSLRTKPVQVNKGRQVDLSRKQFACDLCNMTFTLRHNVQSHLMNFHSGVENMSHEKFVKIERLNRTRFSKKG